ncbi:unnamed protein product [Natator depressus]
MDPVGGYREPLSKPELFRNSSLAGCTIEMVCNVTVGRVDSYLWSKDLSLGLITTNSLGKQCTSHTECNTG